MLEFTSSAIEGTKPLHPDRAKPEIRANYYQYKGINSLVTKDKNNYWIGISIALPCILHFYFNNVLRTKNFLPHLGDIYNEEHYRKFDTGFPKNLQKGMVIEEAIPKITNASRPYDEKRAAAAVLLTQIAVSFCIYHEISHIEIGYIDTYTELSNNSAFLEFSNLFNIDRTFLKVRKVWEYEADKTASVMMISDFFNGKENMAVFNETFEVSIQHNPRKAFGILVSAIYAVFHIFGISKDRKPFYGAHPHPMVRFASILDELVRFLPDRLPDIFLSKDKVTEAGLLGLFKTVSSWEELGMSDSFNLRVKKIWNWTNKYIEKLEKDRLKLNHRYRNNG